MNKVKIRLVKLEQTCYGCPSQWEGRTDNDEPIYIRYRYGYLSVDLGPKGGDINSAVSGKEVFGKQIGEDLDGDLSEKNMLKQSNISFVRKERKKVL